MAAPGWEKIVSEPARRWESGGIITKFSKENGNRRKSRGKGEEVGMGTENNQEGENLLGWTQERKTPKVAPGYSGKAKQSGRNKGT